MTIGEKIRLARLEQGLSQRQLCGDRITRNMLSLIENGAARPSMDTLEFLAKQLGKTVSFFLEEQVQEDPNREAISRARQALEGGDLPGLRAALDSCKEPEGVFREERQLLEFYWHLGQGEEALSEEKLPYAQVLLQRALEITGLYISKTLRQRARVLLTLAGGRGKPDNEDTALLALAMEAEDPARKLEILSAAADQEAPRWCWAMAQAEMALGEYEKALTHLATCREDRETWQAREICCRELGDFKGAYEAACKLREG